MVIDKKRGGGGRFFFDAPRERVLKLLKLRLTTTPEFDIHTKSIHRQDYASI